MKHIYLNRIGFLVALSLVLAACAPKASAPTATAETSNQPYLIKGSYKVTNDFVLTKYYVENAVALTDMHGFVTRDLNWVLPVESQVLGDMTFDPKNLDGTFELSLPAHPLGEFNDVDNNGKKDKGVQIFSVAYSPNLYGGPFAEGDDRSRGWPTYLASVKTDTENKDEVIGGQLVVWSPDANQQFPTGFGADGLLFTADDPVAPIPAGYSIVDLDKKPFAVIQQPTPELTLYEPQDIAIKDYSSLSYTQAFDKMFGVVRKEYAFAGIKGKAPNWDALYTEIRPQVEKAEANKDPNAWYLALRNFTWAFQDGHVSLDAGQYSQKDFQTKVSGGYGFAIREFDDGHVHAIFVMDGGPAQAAGMQVGAEILEFNKQPILDAINGAQSYSNQSSDFALRYQKARYLLTAQPGDTATVKFVNPDGSVKTADLTAIQELQSFSRTSVYYGVDRSSLLPVDERIIPEGNTAVGYIRLNSNADDLNLTVRLFERALQKFTTAQVAGIVIDMRYNTGGTPLGLAGFLTDQEIPMGQLEYYSDKTGKFEPEGLRQTVYPNQNQYRFDKMVLLVGQACFSACEIEAYGFSQVPGMIVVGQTPTAGVEADTARGQFVMPEGFKLILPTGRLTLPDGSIFLDGQGVQPTLRVPVDATTAYSTDDIVLQKGIQAALQPAGAGITPSGPPQIASQSDSQSALSSGEKFLEQLARESYDAATLAKPGKVTYSVSLSSTTTALWSYAWCAADTATLEQNFKNIHLSFNLDGENISPDAFVTFDTQANGKQCRLIYAALNSWPTGEHHLTTTATFTSKINDGTADYEPGEYVLDYTVYVKP